MSEKLLLGFGIKFSFLDLLEWFGRDLSEFLIRKLDEYVPSEAVTKCMEDIRNSDWTEVDSSFLSYALECEQPENQISYPSSPTVYPSLTLQQFLSRHLDVPVTKLQMYPGTYFIGILTLETGEISMSEAIFQDMVGIYNSNILPKIAKFNITEEPKLIISPSSISPSFSENQFKKYENEI